MERPSFRTRARRRIWQETLTSVRRRLVPFVIGIIGVAMGSVYSWLALHKQVKETVEIGLVSGIGANLIWILSVLLFNTVRVPWLLDAESTDLINTQETRAENAEKKLAEMNAARDMHDLFGSLMQQGVQFSQQIRGCQSDAQFASWDRHFGDWNESVQRAMQDLGFLTDAVEFARAGEYATPVSGVISPASNREFRARVLKKHQENLADFVQRRLP